MIQFASPHAQFKAHADAVRAAVARVLDSGVYVLGREVDDFERAFGAFCGVGEAVGVGNGTDALSVALKALDIGQGDEVITVSHTATATVAAILATGAAPVLVDVDPVSFTADPNRIAAAVSPSCKAIVAVHLYGQSADMDAICAVARREGLKVVEDCAQSVGGSYHGRMLGSIGDVASFSFYPTKNLGAIGDGGMIVTADPALAARMRRLRQYGWDEARATEEAGVDSRLDPLQAAILAAKLPHLSADNDRRAAIAQRYAAGLSGLPLVLPTSRHECKHVFHLYVVACDQRDGLMDHLRNAGVGCAVHYPVPVHLQKGYMERVRVAAGGLPVTERLVGRILSLPMYPELGDFEVDTVIATIRGFYSR